MAVQEPGRTKGFPCKQCSLVCPNMPSLLEHMETHLQDDEDRKYKCDECGRGYRHAGSLANHKKTHETGSFQCQICGKENSNTLALKSHLRSHTSQKNCFNNMAALYGHQRTHRGRGGDEPSASDGPYASPPPSHFSPHTQDSSLNFCHLCQVLFSTDEEFQEHIQMHNSSSGSYGAHGDPHDPHTVSYENSVHSPDSNFYASPVNNIPAPPLPEDNEEADEGPDSGERRFKCEVCGKRYRHSGSLINHRRSHQVGIYQCSICRKSYPHLAALKSHLRLHKAQPSSFSLSSEGDWLSSEPLTLEAHAGFPPQEGEGSDSDGVLAPEQEAAGDHGPSYQEAFSQGFPQGRTVHLPQDQHLMQRHQCADCGETFADIAGIKSHACPLHQGHEAGYSGGFGARNGERAAGHPEDPVDFPGVNGNHRDQSYFSEEAFHQHAGGEDADEDADEEDEEDGDLYQCSVCGNRYTSMRALRSHLRGHTQAHATPGSSGPSSMSSHEELKDEGDMMMMMICSTCGESFAKRQDLLAHQLSHNPPQAEVGPPHPLYADGADPAAEPQSSICGCCGLFCSSYQHLKNHGCGAGGKEEPSDGEDGAPGGRPPAPGGEQPPPRPGQGPADGGPADGGGPSVQKRFYNLLALKNHQRSHFDVKRHACHECGKAFKIQKQLLNHLRRHKENQAKIQELNTQIQALMQRNGPQEAGPQRRLAQRGPNAARRRRPAARGPGGGVKAEGVAVAAASEGQGDLRPFSCDQCGRTYRHAGSLVNHKNSHKTGEYCCSVCSNTYPNQLAMRNHLRTHFAYKKHSCPSCGRGFRGRKMLLSHVCGRRRKEGLKGRRPLKTPTSKCKDCKQSFPSAQQLAAHACDQPDDDGEGPGGAAPLKQERPFTCSVCNRSYRHAGSLLNHKNTHKTGHFSCSVCSKPFTNPMALRNHTRIHTQTKKYACLTCGKAFRLASILHNHHKTHSRAAAVFSCPQCGKGFQGRSGLKRHRCQRSQESTPRASGQDAAADKCFMCDLCGRSYRHAGSLLNHKKSHSEALHHCTMCLQTFPDPLTLQIHSQMKRHCCPECGKTFCLISHLQSHMDVHAKDRTPVCSPAQQSFSSPGGYGAPPPQGPYLQQGLQGAPNAGRYWNPGMDESLDGLPKLIPPLAHLGPEGAEPEEGGGEKSHVCDHCGRTYRHAGSLLNHKNSHKTGAFFCAVCQKEFTNLMALKNHRRIHTEPKRYQCLECGKAFRVSTQLICHRRIHTKEKPFACLLCDKSFSSKSNLRHHQKMHQNAQAYEAFSMDANSFMDLDMASFL
ncbi:unnamed protein product [Gadus morhua 'NCC']